MRHYYLQFIAFKSSGKYYSGARHEIGIFDKYPASELYVKQKELERDLDHACGLAAGTVAACDFTVLSMHMDDSSDPIAMSRIIRQSNKS